MNITYSKIQKKGCTLYRKVKEVRNNIFFRIYMCDILIVVICCIGFTDSIFNLANSPKTTYTIDDIKTMFGGPYRKLNLSNISFPVKIGNKEYSIWKTPGTIEKLFFKNVNFYVIAYRKNERWSRFKQI